jgi:hypothetical protein
MHAMSARLTCPHCHQILSLKCPVSAGSKVKCLACQRLFAAPGRTALGGATVLNSVAVEQARPPTIPIEQAYAEPDPGFRERPHYRLRDEDEEPSRARGHNAAAVPILLSLIGVALVVGVGLAFLCFSRDTAEPIPGDVVVAKIVPPVGKTMPVEAPEQPVEDGELQEPVEVAKPPVEALPKPAGPRPKLTPAVQKQINEAIERGALFLQTTQMRNGTWRGIGEHPVGYTALPALTLLECGIPKGHVSIQAAARAVRIGSAKLNKTYELALAILFLDKLGEPKDKKLIQALAMRLVAGQNYAGGWSYECPVLYSQPHQELLTFLQRERKYKLDHLIGKEELANPLRLTETDLARKPIQLAGGESVFPLKSDSPLETLLQDPDNKLLTPSPIDLPEEGGKGLIPGFPEPKDKVPAEKVIAGMAKSNKEAPGNGMISGIVDPKMGSPGSANKETSEPQKDKQVVAKENEPAKATKPPSVPGSLRQLPIFNPVGRGPTYKKLAGLGDHSNTQFALLGLWVARRYDIPLERTFALAELRFRILQNPDGGWGYVGQHREMRTSQTMGCVGLLGLAIGRGSEYELLHLDKTLQGSAVKKLTKEDEGIQRALKGLGQTIGAPTGKTDGLPMQNLYFLWSVERVAVLYNLQTIGNKDWYLWGAEILLSNQDKTGCWTEGRYHQAHPIIDTCFALLFLKRANLAPDLSDNLRLFIPVVDPDRRSSSEGN